MLVHVAGRLPYLGAAAPTRSAAAVTPSRTP